MGLTAVALGAFGAHGLEKLISPAMQDIFETGVRYHFYHALAILIVAAMAGKDNKPSIRYAGWFFTVGILLFSGSLYLLSLRELMDVPAFLGPVTPAGGLFFMVGWVALFLAAMGR